MRCLIGTEVPCSENNNLQFDYQNKSANLNQPRRAIRVPKIWHTWIYDFGIYDLRIVNS